MKRRHFLLCLAGTAAAGITGWQLRRSGATAGLAKVSRTGWALGTQVTLTVYHADAALAGVALTRAFAEIDAVERAMSLYRPDSQLCQLNRAGRLDNPDAALVEVLQAALALAEQTGGVFDPTIQPLWNLYYTESQAGRLPGEDAIRATLARVDWRKVRVSAERIELAPGMELTLNGIAQGYAADAVGRVLAASGIISALIDTGEIGTLGAPARKDQWSVGIKHPRQPQDLLGVAALKGRCLATSGDYETRFGEGYRDHHLLDARTGHSPQEFSSVSVAAPTAMQADALSTAVFLLGLEKGMRLVNGTAGADALFVTKDGRTIRTDGFPVVG